MTEGKGHTTIEYNSTFEQLSAKVSFGNRMSEFKKNRLKDQWAEFKKQVDASIELVEGVHYK